MELTTKNEDNYWNHSVSFLFTNLHCAKIKWLQATKTKEGDITNMQGKTIVPVVIGLVGIYFLIFHTDPLPFNHDSIGLPPFHIVHAIFGIILLAVAVYLWRKNKNT